MNKLVLLLLLGLPALARGADTDIVVAGAGTQSCSDWTEARSEKDEAVDMFLVSWVQGFLSGMNVQRSLGQGGELVPIPDAQPLLAAMDAYCGEQASARVYAGAMALYQGLQARQGAKPAN